MGHRGIDIEWPNDARSGSTLVHVMVCCLTAPMHYMIQCRPSTELCSTRLIAILLGILKMIKSIVLSLTNSHSIQCACACACVCVLCPLLLPGNNSKAVDWLRGALRWEPVWRHIWHCGSDLMPCTDTQSSHWLRNSNFSWIWNIHLGNKQFIAKLKVIYAFIIGSDNGLSPDRRQAIIWTMLEYC